VIDTPFRDGFFSNDGLRLHYVEWGERGNPAVIFLHGTTSNAHSWDAVAGALARRYWCLGLDARNHGESDSWPSGLSWRVQAEDVLALCATLGIDRFGLVTLSMGSRAGIGLAGVWSERVTRLVIEDMAPELNRETALRSVQFQRTTPEVLPTRADLIAWLRRARRYASEEWIERQAAFAADPLPDGRYRLRYRVMPGPVHVNVAGPEADELWALLPKITAPTLILRGGNSRMIDDDLVARMVALIPNACSRVVPRAGHMVHEDNPTVAVAAIAEFFGVAYTD
jgi:pimeloyl-ACP methyl ester carboxylesterase